MLIRTARTAAMALDDFRSALERGVLVVQTTRRVWGLNAQRLGNGAHGAQRPASTRQVVAPSSKESVA